MLVKQNVKKIIIITNYVLTKDSFSLLNEYDINILIGHIALYQWLKAGARGVRDVALIHSSSCTDSIKPSLQFSCNFVVINASEGSLCFHIFRLSIHVLTTVCACFKFL
jgi:hypothetical protein